MGAEEQVADGRDDGRAVASMHRMLDAGFVLHQQDAGVVRLAGSEDRRLGTNRGSLGLLKRQPAGIADFATQVVHRLGRSQQNESLLAVNVDRLHAGTLGGFDAEHLLGANNGAVDDGGRQVGIAGTSQRGGRLAVADDQVCRIGRDEGIRESGVANRVMLDFRADTAAACCGHVRLFVVDFGHVIRQAGLHLIGDAEIDALLRHYVTDVHQLAVLVDAHFLRVVSQRLFAALALFRPFDRLAAQLGNQGCRDLVARTGLEVHLVNDRQSIGFAASHFFPEGFLLGVDGDFRRPNFQCRCIGRQNRSACHVIILLNKHMTHSCASTAGMPAITRIAPQSYGFRRVRFSGARFSSRPALQL